MSRNELLPSLNLATLVIVLVALAIVFAFFLRKRSHRRPMENTPERNIAADLDARKEP